MKKYITSALVSLAALAVQAQGVTFETSDYASVGVYDFWEASPFRTGQLQGNCQVVDNPFKDAANPSDRVLGCQRSLFGSNLYGARVDLLESQRFELTPSEKYVHVHMHKPVEGRCLVIALGKHSTAEWAHQHTDVVQATALSNNTAAVGEWCDMVFPIKGAGNIDIYSLVFVFDCESPHRLSEPFVAYLDDIEVNSSSTPRITLSGDYPISFEKTQRSTHSSTRHLESVKFTVGASTQTVTTDWTSAHRYCYTDKLSQRINVKAGDRVTTAINYTSSDPWMHSYVYLDRAGDGQFGTELAAGGVPTAASDVMTYSYCNGYNSLGQSASQQQLDPPAFTIPADLKPGLYRMRVKIDWDCIDPAGNAAPNNLIYSNAGHVLDFMVNVHADEVTVSNAQRNGTVTTADGKSFSGGYKHQWGKALRVKSVPEKGFLNGGIYVKHGYNLQGDSLVHGNPQYVTEFYSAEQFDANNEIEIPASVLDSDVLIEGVMIEQKNTDGVSASIAVPISSGFNADCIYNGQEQGPSARGPLDTHGSNLIVEYNGMPSGYTVLPRSLSITTDEGHVYQFADASSNNCLTLTRDDEYWTNHDDATTGTLVFAQPVQASDLCFAVVGANKENYDLRYRATANYTDGTSTSAVSLTTDDWGQAYRGIYDVNARWRYTKTNSATGNNFEGGSTFRICEQTISVNPDKAVSSVTFDYDISNKDAWGWGYINIFAVSALNATLADVILPAVDAVDDGAIYDLQGRRYDNLPSATGLYIVGNRKVLVGGIH